MENDHECHKLDYGWVWHKPTWATYGGAAMCAADPAARSSSPHLAAQYWGGAIHKWGVNILSIREGIGPPLLSSQPKKLNFS